jgi:MFS family permease
MLGCTASGLANGAFWALAPVFTAGFSDDISLTAWFMTAVVLGGAAGQWPLGVLSDKIDRRLVIIASALLSAAVGLVMWLMAGSLQNYQIALLGGAWGAVAFPLYSIAAAHANDFAEPEEYVMLSSGLLLMYGIGAIFGPFLASAAMTALGQEGLYFYTACIHILLAAYIVLRIMHRPRAPASHHVTFGDALNFSQTKSQVYEEETTEAEQITS